MKNKIIAIIGIIALLIASFFIGRATSEKEDIKYIPGPVIHDSIPYPVPVIEEIPGDPVYITKRDTFIKDSIIYVSQVIDTAAILADWIKKRSYENTLFDNDTLGKFILYSDVQYNKLMNISYNYYPKYKQVTKTKIPIFEPFAFVGVNSFIRPTFEIGTFIKNVGISGELSHDNNDYFYSFKIGYKW